MSFLKGFGGIVALAIFAAGASARADTIDFSQFGPASLPGSLGTGVPTLTGYTATGVGFRIMAPSGDNLASDREGITFSGHFNPGQWLINSSQPGVIDILFGAPVYSLSSFYAEANSYGDFTVTINGYHGATLVTTDQVSGTSTPNEPTGSAPAFNISYPFLGWTELKISSTDDRIGIILGGVPGVGTPASPIPPAPGVPEPGSWAMMLVGVGLGGASLRRRRRPLMGV